MFEIVAHRGCPGPAPENTLPAFLRAFELGADAVELDVRLTADCVPVVYHYFYLQELTNISGTVFNLTWAEVRQARFYSPDGTQFPSVSIPTLDEVLDALAGRIGLEVEIKGPELESAELIASVLKNHPRSLGNLEVTSYEPTLLEGCRRALPDVPVDLLIPRSEPWMRSDIVAYTALQRGRLAGARAVHLHPSQIDRQTVDLIRKGGLEVHAWDANDPNVLEVVVDLEIPRLNTDRLQQALIFREGIKNGTIS